MLCFPKAKINLGLQILRKRTDGYHDIETVMVPVPLHDALEVTQIATRTEIRMYGTDQIIPTESNLVFKAWKILAERHEIKPVVFHLIKRIPSGAGLGGGSSDAAAALVLLNNFFRLELSCELLTSYAAELGSDCALFVDPKPSLAEGRGEKLNPLDLNLSGYHIVIVQPRFLSDGSLGISTAQAYQKVQPCPDRVPLRKIIQRPMGEWNVNLKNDFESVIAAEFPEIAHCVKSLYNSGAVYAAMSGSGSACFGLFKTKNPVLMFSNRDFFIYSGKM